MAKIRFDRADLGVEVLLSQLRNDVAELRVSEKTDEGFLRVEGRIGRVGVFRYTLNGQTINELRPPEEVFDSQSMQSFSGVPLTLEHPEVDGELQLLGPENSKKFSVGTVGHPYRIGSHLISEILITDKKAIEAAEGGKTKLSGGYTADVFMQSGEFTDDDGVIIAFNAIQRNIRGNHVAITDRPRQGESTEFRMDSVWYDGEATPMAKKKITVHGVEVEVEEAEAEKITAALKIHTDSTEKSKQEDDKISELTGLVAGLQAKLDAKDAESKKDTESEKSKTELKKHAALAVSASKHLDAKDVEAESEDGVVDKLLELDPIDIQKMVIAKVSPSMKLDSDDVAFINGVYSGLMVGPKKETAKKTESLVDVVSGASKKKLDSDDEEMDISQIYRRKIEEDSKAWQV